MSAVSSLARVQLVTDEERVARPRPGNATGGFRSQLQVLREPRVEDRSRARGEQAPKRRRDEDDDDVVVWEQPAQPLRPLPERAVVAGELEPASAPLARGSGQIALPVAPAPVAPQPPKPAPPLVPLTPLEQAVQDLISQLEDAHEDIDEPIASASTVDAISIAAPDTKAPPPVAMLKPHAASAPVRDVAQVAETQQAQSHVHLVIDDGADRVVVTVAVRGSDVNVALRGGDDATTAALARNAGSLDHALRARGLDLSEFTSQPDRESAKHAPRREPERCDDQGPTFSLEELA
jgi:hypothetical protein